LLANEEAGFGIDIELGANFAQIQTEEIPLLEHLMKGFKVKVWSRLPLNLFDEMKSVLGDIPLPVASMLALTLKMNLDVEFEDFEDVKENPMAAPFLATF